jgi:hypothetical protein
LTIVELRPQQSGEYLVHKSLAPMNKEYNDTDINKNICEAVGCFAKATDKIALEGGTYGVISVLVCRNCIRKFRDDAVQETNKLSSGTRSSEAQAGCEL